jgi:hypothetical protein
VLEKNEREKITVMFKTCNSNLEDCTCKDEEKVISKWYGVEIKRPEKEIILEEDFRYN